MAAIAPSDLRVGFMGAGQMAEALARGWIAKGVVTAGHVCCTDPAVARKELFKSWGSVAYDSNAEVCCHTRLLACLPACLLICSGISGTCQQPCGAPRLPACLPACQPLPACLCVPSLTSSEWLIGLATYCHHCVH